MARMITMYHPELDATATVSEGAFYGKGGFRDRGWELYKDIPTVVADPEPEPEPEDPEQEDN